MAPGSKAAKILNRVFLSTNVALGAPGLHPRLPPVPSCTENRRERWVAAALMKESGSVGAAKNAGKCATTR